MARTRYSDEDRARGLAILDACGGNFSRASKDSGVPRATLQEWAAGRVPDSVPAIRQAKRSDLAGRFEAFVDSVLGLTTPEDIRGASLKDRFTAAGIAVDKMRLLRGEATSIDEQRNDARLAEFRSRYGASRDAAGNAGIDAGAQPVHTAPADRAADTLPGA